MILYIHGFGSVGYSDKADLLRETFKGEKVISPTLQHSPIDIPPVII